MRLSTRLHAVLSALLLVPALVATVVFAQRPARGTAAASSSEGRPIVTAADREALRRELDLFLAQQRVEAAGSDVAPVAEEPAPEVGDGGTVWDRLADCESGDWDADGQPIGGTARWDYGLTFDHGDIFEGGLNFDPDTWDAFRDPGMPDHAGNATRAQQIAVGERVLAAQGWQAWPTCSRMLGLR